jgi:predicted CopG family antitoxin
MRSLQVWFEDDDFELLSAAKGETSWREFILTLVTNKKKKR